MGMDVRRVNPACSVRKRAFDIVAASIALVALGPVIVLLALAVKLVGGAGPVLYRARRVGLGGREFDMFKFRSMYVGADSGPQLTAGRDSRVTPIGSLLRATKLDELPQLWNVVRGQMSIVGPRPEAPVFVSSYSPEQRALLSVRPGVTGVVALEYRNEESVLEQVPAAERERFYVERLLPQQLESELRYVRDWRFRHDLALIARTLVAIVTGLGLHESGSSATRRRTSRVSRRLVSLLVLDVGSWAVGVLVAVLFRHGSVLGISGERVISGIVAVGLLQACAGLLIGDYRGRFAVGHSPEFAAVTCSQLAVIAVYNGIVGVSGWAPIGRGTVVAAGYFALLPMLCIRFVYRYWQSGRVPPPAPFAERALVFGAGAGAHQVVPHLLRDRTGTFRPVGLVDDDRDKRHRSVQGVRCVGTSDDLAVLAEQLDVRVLLIADENLSSDELRRVALRAESAGMRVLVLREVTDRFVPLPAESGSSAPRADGSTTSESDALVGPSPDIDRSRSERAIGSDDGRSVVVASRSVPSGR